MWPRSWSSPSNFGSTRKRLSGFRWTRPSGRPWHAEGGIDRGTREFSVLFQGRPLIFHAFPFDLPDLAFAHAEALDHQPSGIGNVNFVVLGVHQSQEDFLAAVFGKLLVGRALCHGTPL